MVPSDRDDRARERDDASNRRDLEAAVRDGLDDEHALSEREIAARLHARLDRESSARDRLAAAEDRRAAQEARDAARRSGE